ncbi:MAG: YiiD C-terminal domain-containing protein [Devosia sp.]|nr:YiiD C-terminal domain-containing protein [Devosia sp.]
MTAAALTHYLHAHIPLSQAMGVSAIEASPARVELGAPLAPNINVHGTAFGGSAATLALLAAWSVLHLRLEAEGLPNRLVIQRSTADYLTPIAGAFSAVATLDNADLESFFTTLNRKGRARLSVTAELVFEGNVSGRLTGDFVALAEPGAA